jgi:hypothetical protein
VTALAILAEPDARVRELYGRYKSLALAAGASLVLGRSCDELAAETAQLLEDARAAVAAHPSRRLQLEACARAAHELLVLLVGQGSDVEAVRESHKHLRREVWKVVPCEYVPCCASMGQEHEQGGESDG